MKKPHPKYYTKKNVAIGGTHVASEFQKLSKNLSSILEASKPEQDSWEDTKLGFFVNIAVPIVTLLLSVASVCLSVKALTTDTKINKMGTLLLNQEKEIERQDSQIVYLIQADNLLKKQVGLQMGQSTILSNQLLEIKKGHDLDYIAARNMLHATIDRIGMLLQNLRVRYGGGTVTFKDSSSATEKLEYLTDVWNILQGESRNIYVFAHDTISDFIQNIGQKIATTKIWVTVSAGLDYTSRTFQRNLSKADSLKGLKIGNDHFYSTVEFIEKFSNYVNMKIYNETKIKPYINLDFPMSW